MKDKETRFTFLSSFFYNIKETISLVTRKLSRAWFGSAKSDGKDDSGYIKKLDEEDELEFSGATKPKADTTKVLTSASNATAGTEQAGNASVISSQQNDIREFLKEITIPNPLVVREGDDRAERGYTEYKRQGSLCQYRAK